MRRQRLVAVGSRHRCSSSRACGLEGRRRGRQAAVPRYHPRCRPTAIGAAPSLGCPALLGRVRGPFFRCSEVISPRGPDPGLPPPPGRFDRCAAATCPRRRLSSVAGRAPQFVADPAARPDSSGRPGAGSGNRRCCGSYIGRLCGCRGPGGSARSSSDRRRVTPWPPDRRTGRASRRSGRAPATAHAARPRRRRPRRSDREDRRPRRRRASDEDAGEEGRGQEGPGQDGGAGEEGPAKKAPAKKAPAKKAPAKKARRRSRRQAATRRRRRRRRPRRRRRRRPPAHEGRAATKKAAAKPRRRRAPREERRHRPRSGAG